MRNLDLRFTYIDSPRLAVLLAVLAAVLVAISYRRAFRGRLTLLPAVLAAARALASAACLLILLRPVVSFDRIGKKEARAAILIDRSLSMGIPDSVGGETRLASALRVARSAAAARLGEAYRLEAYSFPGGERLPAAVPDLEATGATTDLAAAWSAIETGSGKLDAIVLLTDGRDNRPERYRGNDVLPPAPIYAVGLGSGASAAPDLAITGIETEEKILRGNRIEVRVAVRSRGFPAAPPVATKLTISLDGADVATREVKLEPGETVVRVPLQPDRPGTLIYEARLDPRPEEIFRENNSRRFSLDVAEKLLQVLIYEGRVRWEYKFVRETLARDPDVNPTGLVRTGPDKLLQQGEAPADLSRGLPATREEWRKFDVLVLGDVGREGLPAEAVERLKAWVAEDGGGLIYLGGPTSYPEVPGSPLAELLPVEIRTGGKLEGKPVVEPAAGAIDHPILRGLAGRFLPEEPGGAYGVEEAFDAGGPRPGADPLLLVRLRGPGGESAEPTGGGGAAAAPARILLAAQQYGRGRSVSWLTDSDWRWVMLRGAEGGRAIHSRLWGQMVRWAAKRDDAPAGGEVALRLLRRVASAGDRVRVEARGPKEKLAALQVRAAGPGGEDVPVTGLIEGGTWAGEFVPGSSGRWEVRLVPGAVAVASAEKPAAPPAPAAAPAGKAARDGGALAVFVEPGRQELEPLIVFVP